MASLTDISALLDQKLAAFKTDLKAELKEIVDEISAKLDIPSIKQLQVTSTEHTETLQKLELHIKELEASLDDQVNRSMRNNRIFKNIKEEGNETWDMTKDTIAKYLQDVTEDDHDTISESIDHAHRGGKKSTCRTIFVRFNSSSDASYYFDCYKKLAISSKNTQWKMEHQYSPKVTARRNEALFKHKDLIQNKTVSAGYIDYPAKLMVKGFGQGKYTLHQEF